MKTLLLALASVLLLGGCELMQPPSNEPDPVLVKLNELERRMEAIERVVQNQSLVNLTQQVGSMERRDDEIQGRIEELEHNSETTADRQRQLYADIDARIQELEASVQASSSTGIQGGGALSPGQLPVPGGSDRENYQAAFELLKEQRYEEAGVAFEQFLLTYANSELADNAQYWLAESHYVTQKFDEALAEFAAVVTRYPQSRKVPDALLKIGYCNYELEQWDAARNALERVQADFSETTAARLAGQRLDRMDEEGV